MRNCGINHNPMTPEPEAPAAFAVAKCKTHTSKLAKSNPWRRFTELRAKMQHEAAVLSKSLGPVDSDALEGEIILLADPNTIPAEAATLIAQSVLYEARGAHDEDIAARSKALVILMGCAPVDPNKGNYIPEAPNAT